MLFVYKSPFISPELFRPCPLLPATPKSETQDFDVFISSTPRSQ